MLCRLQVRMHVLTILVYLTCSTFCAGKPMNNDSGQKQLDKFDEILHANVKLGNY